MAAAAKTAVFIIVTASGSHTEAELCSASAPGSRLELELARRALILIRSANWAAARHARLARQLGNRQGARDADF